jgi:hypothetical protein
MITRTSIEAAILAAPIMVVASAAGAQVTAAGTGPIAAAEVYNSSARMPTNFAGIMRFADPPAGFNPVTATPEQRAQYGFPPAPDRAADPNGYAVWQKAMTAASHAKHYTGPLKGTNLKSMPARMAAPLAGTAAVVEGGPTNAASYNWSGIVNTRTNTSFTKGAFDLVYSEFTVPSAQEPYGVCDSSQYYYAGVWNGIDGWSNSGDVLQAGATSYATCSGGVNKPGYYSWIEWYPSYPVIEAYDVNPGDVMFVETYATSARQGYLYVYDYALQIYDSYQLTPTGSTQLIGNSAEYIVERPCCDAAGYDTALANYLISPAWEQYNYTGTGVMSFTGNTAATTFWVSMVNDQGTEYISVPYAVGVKSVYSTPAEAVTVFQSENCAFSGGCVQN